MSSAEEKMGTLGRMWCLMNTEGWWGPVYYSFYSLFTYFCHAHTTLYSHSTYSFIINFVRCVVSSVCISLNNVAYMKIFVTLLVASSCTYLHVIFDVLYLTNIVYCVYVCKRC